MESLEIVHENAGLAEPLTVKLAPESLSPAGIGDREMYAVGIDVMPVTRRNEMTESIQMAMRRDFRITGSTGSEVHEIRIVTAGEFGRICGTLENVAASLDSLVEIEPAVAFALNYHAHDLHSAFFDGKIDLMSNIAVGSAYDSFNVGSLESVGKIVLNELICSRNNDRAYLMERNYREPELIMTFKNEHYLIAFSDSHGAEIIGGHVGILLDFGKRELSVVHVVVNVDKRRLVGIFSGKSVHNVESEVERFHIFKSDILHRAVFIRIDLNEFIGNGIFYLGKVEIRNAGENYGFKVLDSALRSVCAENNSVEFTFAAAYRPFVVRLGTVIINRIALVENFDIIAHPDFQLTAYNDVHLLTLVGMRMRNSVFFINIGYRYEKRLADLVFEVGSKAHIGQTLSSDDRETLACSCDIEAVDVR